MHPGTKSGCFDPGYQTSFGHTPVCTWVPNLVVLVILGYVPEYQTWLFRSYSGRYRDIPRFFVFFFANPFTFFARIAPPSYVRQSYSEPGDHMAGSSAPSPLRYIRALHFLSPEEFSPFFQKKTLLTYRVFTKNTAGRKEALQGRV